MGSRMRLAAMSFLAGLGTAPALVDPALAETQPAEPQLAWHLNGLGLPGLIDMPSALSPPDAQFTGQIAGFRNTLRYSLTWTASDRLTAAFRYALLFDLRGVPGGKTVYPSIFDRSFSLHYRLLDEGPMWPALALGLNDVAGTGIYGGEYLVATRTLSPRLRLTGGIGWGRLGSYGGFANPLGVLGDGFDSRSYARPEEGGTLTWGSWFHGPAALFGGVEYQLTDALSLTAEYSSDAYQREAGTAFAWKTPVNLGLTWAAGPGFSLSAQAIHGGALGVQADWTFNPKTPRAGSGYDAAGPMLTAAPVPGGDLARDLADRGLRLLGQRQDGALLEVDLANDRYVIAAQALGRAARVLVRDAPKGVARFRIILSEAGMPVTQVTLDRAALLASEFFVDGSALSRADARISDATAGLPRLPGAFPAADVWLGPYLKPVLFDPDAPLRADLGLALNGRVDLAPGLVLAASLQQRVLGTLDQQSRVSNSTLPHVRSDAWLYDKAALTLPTATIAWYARPGPDLYARITGGLLEPMFAGLSGELLWKPQASRLALGLELDALAQRGYDQALDLRDYRVVTGFATAYYAFGSGVTARLDLGRYLAGDQGATLTLGRRLDNGWEIAVFATRTDVSAAEFGEGSFDKGFSLTIPLSLVGGQPRREVTTAVIHAVGRDGGAMPDVPGRLYDTIRADQQDALDATWGRFWK